MSCEGPCEGEVPAVRVEVEGRRGNVAGTMQLQCMQVKI